MLDLIPKRNLVIVRQTEIVKQTDSGIIIEAENGQGSLLEKFEGEVLEVGPAVVNTVVGEIVMFGKNAFSSVWRNGEEYIIIYDTDIICEVISKEE